VPTTISEHALSVSHKQFAVAITAVQRTPGQKTWIISFSRDNTQSPTPLNLDQDIAHLKSHLFAVGPGVSLYMATAASSVLEKKLTSDQRCVERHTLWNVPVLVYVIALLIK